MTRLPNAHPSRPRRHSPRAQRAPSTDIGLQDTITGTSRGVALTVWTRHRDPRFRLSQITWRTTVAHHPTEKTSCHLALELTEMVDSWVSRSRPRVSVCRR